MADILIRGMEMPEPGQNIIVVENWDGSVYARLEQSENYCTLHPLPKGHGKLIDGDRFRVILCRLKDRQYDDTAIHVLSWVIERLDKLESVVDAEGEDE